MPRVLPANLGKLVKALIRGHIPEVICTLRENTVLFEALNNDIASVELEASDLCSGTACLLLRKTNDDILSFSMKKFLDDICQR